MCSVRLEDYVSSIRHNRKPVILLETNDSLKGLKFIDPLYKAILSRKPVTIVYKSFKARDIQRFIFLLSSLRSTGTAGLYMGGEMGLI